MLGIWPLLILLWHLGRCIAAQSFEFVCFVTFPMLKLHEYCTDCWQDRLVWCSQSWMVWMMQYGFARFLMSWHQVIWGQGSRQDRASIPVAEDHESNCDCCCVLKHLVSWRHVVCYTEAYDIRHFVTFVGQLRAADLYIICSRPNKGHKVWSIIKWVTFSYFERRTLLTMCK